MDNNSNKKLLHSIDTINKLYDKLSYLDIYGTSVLIFILVTIFVFFVYLYCSVMQSAEIIKKDWTNQRCNPKVIPFAGFINKPDDKSVFEFTEENFNYCIQGILVNITGFSVQPFNYLLQFITSVFESLQAAINAIRLFMANIRIQIADIAKNVLTRIVDILIPLQQIFIALKDSISKVQGILVAGLYTSLGTYYALKSLLGAIVQFIIIILLILVGIIIGLWILPFTWPVAATTSLVFLGVSIPLAIIVLFMTEVLHIQTDGIPGLPSAQSGSCFDADTCIQMDNGDYKKIKDIEAGEVLYKNNKVTAKITAHRQNQKMFSLHNVIVSESHVVKYKKNWIYVKNHPESIELTNYENEYLYCLNTSNKEIYINNTVFTDWDEIYDEKLDTILQVYVKKEDGEKTTIKNATNIHKYLDKGFHKNTTLFVNNTLKCIKEVNIGDIIGKEGTDIVYGIVEIDASDILGYKYLDNRLDNHLVTNDLDDSPPNKIYHLLTYSNKFTIGTRVYLDYNSLIDVNLI